MDWGVAEMNQEKGKIVLKGRKVVGGRAEGEALVSKVPVMGWGNVDYRRGITTERGHPLLNIPLKGKVFVFPEPRGSGGWIRYGFTKFYGTNPIAMVYRKGVASTVLAALAADIPTVADFETDPSQVIDTGDYVIVDGDNGIVEVMK
jgi:predicted aconitase with swiveling domain